MKTYSDRVKDAKQNTAKKQRELIARMSQAHKDAETGTITIAQRTEIIERAKREMAEVRFEETKLLVESDNRKRN